MTERITYDDEGLFDEFVTYDGAKITFPEPQPFDLSFYDGAENIGRLWVEDGELKFEGKADESAQVFFDAVIAKWARDTKERE